ncbi:MAG TPA: type II secretion system F family protein, partial [Candidatus Acidoferrales bacterium]|nr:type II secretion system F family protein [Candidatus Acidoferrales bacterium]
MPVYAYKGLNTTGRAVSGIVDAENPKGARQKLRKDNIFPTDLVEEHRREAKIASGEGTWGNLSRMFERMAPEELALLTRQLATLVGAGLPLVDCLSALIEQVEGARTKRILSQIREQVTEGTSL